MCGRVTLSTPSDVIAQTFGLAAPVSLLPRYNIAPTHPIAAVRVDEKTGARRLSELRWGLIPYWAADPAIGNRMINARAESVADKPAYRDALRKRRCLVVVDGYYEWRGRGKAKQAYLLRTRDGSPFGLAGLWEVWRALDGRRIESGVIITSAAGAVVRPIHERMPVIIAPAAFALWLDPAVTDAQVLRPLLAPREDAELTATAVTNHVNDPRNDDPTCVEPQPSLL